ncbi:PREDICTED: phosphatidylglycerol/phosphatidylinositol transfer protein-like [Amphimedon queenslandica]|uniref:MD-2-related lipid-recognition domain-containing protein n=1 Tax=Amphimedon queenslandica TaxID=400682 RepID=A0AAN0JL67_AMPQE|nr:PREDICTED: phosphatidylglycerol/phosphatidylinositol transfer protein-like [Amphimedon queenslandica]|eukprot:XP_019857534.1 PREDICTED: phosphatidylglycerol/phosphatidylinositol transfer protein-like [Amphimedon queenslandica]
MSALLMILSVVLVVSTLTGSTNNYYNEPTGNKEITDCSITKKFGELNNASIIPVPLKRGEKSYWKGLLKIKRMIHWGIVHLTMTHNFKNYTNITFLDEKFNLCDYLDDIIKKYCPVHPRIYDVNASATMSKLLWPGQYNARITAYNEKGEQIMCLMKEITIN